MLSRDIYLDSLLIKIILLVDIVLLFYVKLSDFKINGSEPIS